MLKYREKFQISTNMWQEYLSGKWQYQSNLHVLPTVSSFWFGQFVFKVIFSCIVLVSVAYFYRSASMKATKRFPAVDLFIGRVSFGYKKILTGGGYLHGNKNVWEHWSAL